jgi:uncharacterized SAM-binding protein YcdF (DUF218 family)
MFRILFSVLVVFGVIVLRDAPAKWLIPLDPPTTTDAALVFGGDPAYERTLHAARLFRDGQTQLLILCGGEPGPGDHATSLQKVAMKNGVPADKTVLEDQSTSTREAVVYSKPVLEAEGVRSLTLVTSPYHQRRAYWVAKRIFGNDVKLVNSPAEPSFWSPLGWWKTWSGIRIVLEEYGKLAYYFLRGWI